MGDRCYVRLECRRRDLQRFLDEGFQEDGDAGDPETRDGVVVVDTERNYGLQCGDFKGAVFFGRHDAGDDYGACVFASDGKESVEAEAGHGGYEPVVQYDEDGLCPTDMETAKRYWQVRRNAVKKMGGLRQPAGPD